MKQFSFVTIALIMLAFTVRSQNKISIKAYQNTDAFSTKYVDYYSNKLSDYSHLNFNRITLAVNWVSKHNLAHEIELFIPEINKTFDKVQFPFAYEAKKNSHYEILISTYSARYELNKPLLKPLKNLVFSTGVGINPYYLIIENKPIQNDTYYASRKYYGASLYIVPRLVLSISQRFSLDLNIPFNLFDLHRIRTRVHNPSIPKRQQINDTTENTFFMNAYSLRFGLMYSINKRSR